MKRKILLHSCCGPCSSAVIERLAPDWDISVFYFNPNITDEEEYKHRLEEQKRLLDEFDKLGIKTEFYEGDWDPDSFFEAAAGLEDEPEGGKRCLKCFELRLKETAKKAAQLGIECFDSTLSVSPHKNYEALKQIGEEIASDCGLEFEAGNYKKKDGFKRSTELAKQFNLYRQNYCGCCFSKRPEENVPED